MNFELDPELERIQKLARELAEDFATRASQHDQESTAPDENYAKLKEAGFYGLVAPKQYGGLGGGVLGWVVAAEELAPQCQGARRAFANVFLEVGQLDRLVHRQGVRPTLHA